MPSLPSLDEPLSDGVVKVRLAAERDIPEVLIAYQDDPELHRRLGAPRPPSGAELGRRSEFAEEDRLAGRRLTATILEGTGDLCLGQIDVQRVDWDHGRGELTIWVAPKHRGRGLAGRALGLFGPWLLLKAGLERVEILTEPGNAPMLAVARAAGFSYEGELRGYYRREGSRADAAVLSLVRRDLPA